MIKYDKPSKKMESTYYLKPGQTLDNTKIADRSLTLVLSKNAFDRFVDYTTENERRAAAAKEEAAKLEALKKATYEMSKSWDDTIANIKKRRRHELLNKNKREKEGREKFLKELKARNASERAEVVAEARKLLLWKKPQCRLINRALFTSECFRELNAQIAFNKTIRDIDRKRDVEFTNTIKENIAKFAQEEKNKALEEIKKKQAYRELLKKQIDGTGDDTKHIQLEERKVNIVDAKNLAKVRCMLEKCEAEQTSKRKKELAEIFKTAIEDKKYREMELKRNDAFENLAIEALVRSKDRIKEIGESRMKQAMEEKIRISEALAKRCAAFQKSREAAEQERLKKAILEKEELEREKEKAKKKQEEDFRAGVRKHGEESKAIKERRANEKKSIIAWETFQRLKKDEYDKQVKLEEAKRQWKIKNETASQLQKQMAEKEAARKAIIKTEAVQMREIIDRTNNKVLTYGEEVLQECREHNESYPDAPPRPLFPIIRAIEAFKKESGLIPPKKYEENEAPKKRRRRKRPVCAKTVPPEQIIYL